MKLDKERIWWWWLYREKGHLDRSEAMQRDHIANEHKYSQAIKELQAKVSILLYYTGTV